MLTILWNQWVRVQQAGINTVGLRKPKVKPREHVHPDDELLIVVTVLYSALKESKEAHE